MLLRKPIHFQHQNKCRGPPCLKQFPNMLISKYRNTRSKLFLTSKSENRRSLLKLLSSQVNLTNFNAKPMTWRQFFVHPYKSPSWSMTPSPMELTYLCCKHVVHQRFLHYHRQRQSSNLWLPQLDVHDAVWDKVP